MDPNVESLRERLMHVLHGLGPDVEPSCRSMFGGCGVYAAGRVFATISNVGLGLKLSPEDIKEALQIEGAAMLRYEEAGPPSKQYVAMPQAITGDSAVLEEWVRRSIDYVRTLPEKPKPKR